MFNASSFSISKVIFGMVKCLSTMIVNLHKIFILIQENIAKKYSKFVEICCKFLEFVFKLPKQQFVVLFLVLQN